MGKIISKEETIQEQLVNKNQGNAETGEENDEIDSLLKSDDEEMDETEDIQKLLLADVSDDDSDDEEETSEEPSENDMIEKETNDNAAENLGSHNKKPEDNDAAYDGLDVAEG